MKMKLQTIKLKLYAHKYYPRTKSFSYLSFTFDSLRDLSVKNKRKLFFVIYLMSFCLSTAEIFSQQYSKFYPLQNDNVWFYRWSYDDGKDSSYAYEKIINDTVLNNYQKYFTRETRYYKDKRRTIFIRTERVFERIDENINMVLQFNKNEPFPNEIKILNLSASKGDSTTMDSRGFFMICTGSELMYVFNQPRFIKRFSFPQTKTATLIIDGIGQYNYITGISGDFSSKILLSAKINGVYFGDSLTISSASKSIITSNFSLSQNYPNPFNPSTTIDYQLSTPGFVTLKVYDLLGREVATLVDEFKTAGSYNSQFSIRNSSPRSTRVGAGQLPSGVYFYRLQSGGYSETKKLILLK